MELLERQNNDLNARIHFNYSIGATTGYRYEYAHVYETMGTVLVRDRGLGTGMGTRS